MKKIALVIAGMILSLTISSPAFSQHTPGNTKPQRIDEDRVEHNVQPRAQCHSEHSSFSISFTAE